MADKLKPEEMKAIAEFFLDRIRDAGIEQAIVIAGDENGGAIAAYTSESFALKAGIGLLQDSGAAKKIGMFDLPKDLAEKLLKASK